METAHTPGPWNYQRGVEEDRCYVWGGNPSPHQTFIGHVYSKLHGRVNRGEEEANARLIAAAPDLLNTLIGLERGLNDLEEMCRRIVGDAGTANLAREKADWCRAAIAKVTGKLPS